MAKCLLSSDFNTMELKLIFLNSVKNTIYPKVLAMAKNYDKHIL